MKNLVTEFMGMPIISDYYAATENLDEFYLLSRNQLDDSWLQFNQNLAKSLVYIYGYYVCLDSKIQKKYETKERQNISRKLSFYYDFIVSKPSNSIFTETPKESLKDLYPLNGLSIAKIAKNLFQYISNAPQNYDITNDREFKIKFQRLFHKSFSYYDFIFSGTEGVFSNFEYNYDLFKKVQSFYTNYSNDLNELILLRDICTKSLVINLNITLNYMYSREKDINYKDINYKSIYTDFIEESKSKNPPKLEIFTYILANKIWKIDKIYQNRLEEDEHNSKDYVMNMKEYIIKYLEAIELYYSQNIDENKLYLKIANLDQKFIFEFIFKDFLSDIKNSSLDAIKYSAELCKISKENKVEKVEHNITDSVSNYAINNKEYEKFKFYRIIAKAKKWNEISDIIDALNIKIFNKYSLDELKTKVQYMGILRSGSFLAHALNILKIKQFSEEGLTQISESLLTHPYLSIVPRHIINRKSVDDKIIVYLDESIKTGYGITISHLYRKKILQRFDYTVNRQDSIFVVANFSDYKEKINLELDKLKCVEYSESIIPQNLEYDYLVDCKRKFNKEENNFELVCESSNNLNIENKFDWHMFLNTLKLKDNALLSNIIMEYAKEDVKYDFTKVISNSILLFMIGKNFATELHTKFQNSGKLIFFPGSTEGKLLVDITVFVYKVLFADTAQSQQFFINGKNYRENIDDEQDIIILFDMTIMTGETSKKIYELDVAESMKNIKKDFDVKFVLHSLANKIDNIYSITDEKGL